jgi:hypothetical protein
MEHDFDDIEFESGMHLVLSYFLRTLAPEVCTWAASRDVRYGSMIKFYESEGIVLPPVQESPTTVDWCGLNMGYGLWHAHSNRECRSRMAEHECFNDSHISEGARELSSESGSDKTMCKSDTPTGSHVHHSGHAASWSAGV